MTEQRLSTNAIQVLYQIRPQVRTRYFDFYGREYDALPDEKDAREVYSKAEAMNRVRALRNTLLSACDWTQLADVIMTDDERVSWQTYRQDLRDFPARIDVEYWVAPDWPLSPSEAAKNTGGGNETAVDTEEVPIDSGTDTNTNADADNAVPTDSNATNDNIAAVEEAVQAGLEI
jgi:hypothetical protein